MGKFIIALIVSTGLLVCVLLNTNQIENLRQRRFGFVVNREGGPGGNSSYHDRVSRACTNHCLKNLKGTICGPENDAHCCKQGHACHHDNCMQNGQVTLRTVYTVKVGVTSIAPREFCVKPPNLYIIF
jgi:hypothetical protein